jgi:hypothetical protein
MPNKILSYLLFRKQYLFSGSSSFEMMNLFKKRRNLYLSGVPRRALPQFGNLMLCPPGAVAD